MPQDPIFQSIFGVPWDQLPPVMRAHYAVRPRCEDRVLVTGTMNIERNRLARAMAPLLDLFGALIPADGRAIPATVAFYSGPDSDDFHLDRTVSFPGRPPVRFRSRLKRLANGDVVEFMRFGIGWRCAFTIDADRVILSHRGYVMAVGRWLVPLPLAWIIGVRCR